MKTHHQIGVILCWSFVIVVAVFLRFNQLGDRPFHFDEATGARITSQRMDPASGYDFNPVHNHGPLLSAVANPICHVAGETTWKQMSKTTLRLVPAIAGTLLVLIPLLWRRRFGDAPMLAAAALLATSPVLVYYSRIFIHEMLLTLCGLTAVVLLCRKPKYGILGICLGLMFATKESFAISILAWTAAGALVVLTSRLKPKNIEWQKLWLEYHRPVAITIITAALTAGFFYTNGLRSPEGALDAIRTFFVYQTESGHDKAFAYYSQMLIIPNKAGIWWFETPILILALVAFLQTHLPSAQQSLNRKSRFTVRFIAYAALFHFLIYSLIPYKTPWLMCLPWAHVCLLAGLSLRQLPQWKTPTKIAIAVVFAGILIQQSRLSRFATGRFAGDVKNPYAYTPTSRDAEAIEQWMHELSRELPPSALEPVAVVGTQYWPLPWYLREFESIGYWPEPAAAIEQSPLVFAMPEVANQVNEQLKNTHVALPRTLRTQVPIILYLRKDHWDHWLPPESP